MTNVQKVYAVSSKGRAALRAFLDEHHCNPSSQTVDAWAAYADDVLRDRGGDALTIEMAPVETADKKLHALSLNLSNDDLYPIIKFSSATSNKPTLAIVLEGGMVSSIVSAAPELMNFNVVVIDYDIAGLDPAELVSVVQDDGQKALAAVHRSFSVDKAEIDLSQFATVEA